MDTAGYICAIVSVALIIALPVVIYFVFKKAIPEAAKYAGKVHGEFDGARSHAAKDAETKGPTQ